MPTGEIIARWQSAAGTDRPWDAIESALAQVPEPDAWALSDDAATLFALTQRGVIFTVSVSEGSVVVRSRPLALDRLVVSLERSGPTTRWTFRYLDQPDPSEPWQTITGTAEPPDAREVFARALARRAGWEFGSPVSGEPEEEEPRWRRQTDLWGKPIGPR